MLTSLCKFRCVINVNCSKNRAMDACKLVVDMIKGKQLKPLHSTFKLLTNKVLVQGGLKEALELLGCMKIRVFHVSWMHSSITYHSSKTGTADEAMFVPGRTDC